MSTKKKGRGWGSRSSGKEGNLIFCLVFFLKYRMTVAVCWKLQPVNYHLWTTLKKDVCDFGNVFQELQSGTRFGKQQQKKNPFHPTSFFPIAKMFNTSSHKIPYLVTWASLHFDVKHEFSWQKAFRKHNDSWLHDWDVFVKQKWASWYPSLLQILSLVSLKSVQKQSKVWKKYAFIVGHQCINKDIIIPAITVFSDYFFEGFFPF